MNEPLTPDVGFCTLLIICGLSGWIVSIVTEARHALPANLLVGTAGWWIGSQMAQFLGIVVRGSLGHFSAALLGAVLIAELWRRVHPPLRGGASGRLSSA